MDENEVEEALEAARVSGDSAPVTPVLEAYRARIERMLRLRMDPRVLGRVGVSDVVQDAYLEIAARLPGYLEEQREEGAMPFYPWVRFIAAQALQTVHRRHLGTLRRDAGREWAMDAVRGGDASSAQFANALAMSGLSPASAASIEEQREAVTEALESLSAADREVLFLRHFEQLSGREVAAVLGLTPSGASLRHLKALGRLQRALARCGIRFEPGDAE